MPSLSLLHQIWARNTGIVVIFTGRTQQTYLSTNTNSHTIKPMPMIKSPSVINEAVRTAVVDSNSNKSRRSTSSERYSSEMANYQSQFYFMESFCSSPGRYLDVELKKLGEQWWLASLFCEFYHSFGNRQSGNVCTGEGYADELRHHGDGLGGGGQDL